MRVALWPWSACPEIGDVVAISELEDEMRVRLLPDGIVANRYSAGSGRWATASELTVRLTRGRCDAAGYLVDGGKESLHGAVTLLSYGGGSAPTLADTADLARATVVSSVDAAELAAARMLVQLAGDGEEGPAGSAPGSGIFGPAWPVQPEHAGRPRGSPASLWSPASLAAAAASVPTNEEGEPYDGVHVWRIREPTPLVRRGRWELWELRFRARLGGGVLAVYDHRTNRHRWLWASEWDEGRRRREFGASHFDVLSFERGIVVLRNRPFDGGERLWAIDVARGVTRPVQVDGAIRLVPGGVTVTDESGQRRALAFSELRP